MLLRLRRIAITFYPLFQIALAGLGAAGIVLFVVSPWLVKPWEDAVILFDYSANLAKTGVISYYPGGPRAEGATDFLWMALLALARKIGIDSFYLANLISIAAAVGIAIVLQKIARQQPRLYPTLIISGLIFLTPQTLAAVGGFSVFPFGFLIALLTWLLLEQRPAGACVTALLLCLLRPDGIVFAVPLLALFLFTGERRARAVRCLILFFLLPGLAYFLWRWHYFGNLLPLPFWVKSETTRRFGLFVSNDPIKGLRHLEVALLIIAAGCGLALRLGTNLRLLSGLILIPCLFYFQMRLDQNIGGRFFFFAYISMGILLAVNWSRRLIPSEFLLPASLALWVLAVAPFWLSVARITVTESAQRQSAIATALGSIPGPNSMITTEGGVLPYYSHWIAYDAWGLNTARFARHIPVPSDVAEIHPDLVVVHRVDNSPCFFDSSWQLPYETRTWENMEKNLIAGAAAADYDLWLQAFPAGSHKYICWFVKRSSPNRNAVDAILSRNAFLSPVAVVHMGVQADMQRQRTGQIDVDQRQP
ncbi:MAG: hypothetical protein JOZ83_05875 [Silvibacterium sp.]|nr:hypothetical protein [Silvibacterium sp.]